MNVNQAIPEDVREEILRCFKVEDADYALELVAMIGAPRLMRCAVHSSLGNLERLLEAIDIAKKDYRDLIYWTEYDKSKRQIWDFNLPFPDAKVG